MTASPRTCFYIPPDQHDENGWIPSVVTEGEPGHAPLTGNGPCASPWYWGKTLAEAQGTAAVENARLGLTRDEVASIIASSLRTGNGQDIYVLTWTTAEGNTGIAGAFSTEEKARTAAQEREDEDARVTGDPRAPLTWKGTSAEASDDEVYDIVATVLDDPPA